MTNIIEAESTIQEVRTAETIAVEINTIKRQTQKVMLSASIEIGKRLSEAKDMVEHGYWGQWLQDNVSYSERTAQNLIKVYEQFGDSFGVSEMDSLFAGSQANIYEELSYTQALALLSLPTEEERKAFVQENNVQDMSTRELQDAIKAKKEAEAKANTADIEIRKLQKQLDEAEQKAVKSERDAEDDEKLRKDLTEKLTQAKQEIQQLQNNLEEATVAPLDPEKEKRIKELEERIRQLQKEKEEDEDKRKFQTHLKMIQTTFNDMLKDITTITEDEKREQYKTAAKKMLERLGELV